MTTYAFCCSRTDRITVSCDIEADMFPYWLLFRSHLLKFQVAATSMIFSDTWMFKVGVQTCTVKSMRIVSSSADSIVSWFSGVCTWHF